MGALRDSACWPRQLDACHREGGMTERERRPRCSERERRRRGGKPQGDG